MFMVKKNSKTILKKNERRRIQFDTMNAFKIMYIVANVDINTLGLEYIKKISNLTVMH